MPWLKQPHSNYWSAIRNPDSPSLRRGGEETPLLMTLTGGELLLTTSEPNDKLRFFTFLSLEEK